MRSLTATLFKGVILGAALVLATAGTFLYLSVSSQVVRQLDESLSEKARMLAQSVEFKSYGLEVDLEEMGAPEMEEADFPDYLYLTAPDGRIVYRSSAVEKYPVREPGAVPDLPRSGWFKLPDGRVLRSVSVSFIPGVDDEEEDRLSPAPDPETAIDTASERGGQVLMVLFRDAGRQRSFLRLFLGLLVAAGTGSIVLLSLIVWIIIKRGAEPVRDLASGIEALKDKDLALRFDEKNVLPELAPIVRKLNVFLGYLEESFDRERGFTSDAAHELRTPLAGLKSTIEVALSRDREEAQYRETLLRALEIIKQLEGLTGSLLALARLESGQEAVLPAPIDLQGSVFGTWDLYRTDADLKDLDFSFEHGCDISATVDRDLFARVLEELFGNAVYYSDRGGSIRVLMQEKEGRVSLSIGNTGSRVSAADADRLFHRFWRGSGSRDDTGKHFGLGLPIVRRMVEVMGGELRVETEEGGEFWVIVTLPVREQNHSVSA